MKRPPKKSIQKNKKDKSKIIPVNTEDEDEDLSINEYLIAEKPFRFVVLIICSLLFFANSFQWASISSISNEFQRFYNLSAFQTYLFSNLYLIVYIIMTFPSFYLIEKKSLKFAIKISSLLTLVGGFFKAFINTSLIFAYIGQFLCAIGRPLIMNAPAKIASNWFRSDRRVVATSIIVSFNIAGVVLSFLLPTWYFNDSTNSTSEEEFKSVLKDYSLSEAIITLCLCAPSILLMKSKPDIPPSNSQQAQNELGNSVEIMDYIKNLFRNQSFVYLLISFTCINGFYYFYPVIINDYLTRYHIETSTTSYLIVFSSIGGIIGLVFISILVDRKKVYRLTCLILNLLMIIIFTSLTIYLELYNKEKDNLNYFVLITCFFSYGFCLIPLYSVAMDFACELTFPIGESVSTGILFSCSHLLGALSTIFVDLFLKGFNQYKFLPNLYSIMLFFISFIFLFLLKEKLMRKKEDGIKKLMIRHNNFNQF